MRSNEPALRALKTLTEFEIAEASAEVASAAARTADARRRVTLLTHRCEAAVGGLRDAFRQRQLNPPLLSAMRSLYKAESESLREARQTLSSSHDHEENARAVLAGIRNRDRSLVGALRDERTQWTRRQETIEIASMDDFWLHQTRSAL